MQFTTQRFQTLRGLLAIWVLLGHMLITEKYSTIYNAGFASHNDLGGLGLLSVLHFVAVDIFFMLSGFTLSLRYGNIFTKATKGKEIDRFYWRRLVRIWPLHALMVGVIGLMAYMNIPHPISSGAQDVIFNHWKWSLALNMLLMNGWGIMPVASWNEPAWTLSVTFLLYVLFPNLTLITKRLPQRNYILIILITALLMGYGILLALVPLGSNSDGAGGVIRGLAFFICGILLARIEIKLKPIIGIAAFIIAALAWTYLHPFPLTILHLTYPLLILSLADSHRPIIPARISHWLGDISFPLFLSHYPVLLLIQYMAGERLAHLASQNGWYKAVCYIGVIGICFSAADLLRRLDTLLHKQKTPS